jgi:hypothetical protein
MSMKILKQFQAWRKTGRISCGGPYNVFTVKFIVFVNDMSFETNYNVSQSNNKWSLTLATFVSETTRDSDMR